MTNRFNITSILLITFGFILAGFFPGYFYYKAKMDNRNVTVKGLAEMDVVADLAIWEIKFIATGKVLNATQNTLENNKDLIVAYLKEKGFSDNEVSVARINTNDLETNPYSTPKNSDARYILTQSIYVQSDKVNNVENGLSNIGELVAKGVIFDNQEYGSPVFYLFTKLNDVKPKMLEQATKNAKAAAEEFAKNSDTKVGKIKTAYQGVFSILPKNAGQRGSESSYINKKIRVVSTVTYYLE